MHRSGILVLSCVAMVALAATGASAQNMLVNPDFDTDVTTGWSGFGVWDPMDVFGSPTSGSATWINTWASGGAIYHTQCVEVGPDFEAYDLAGYALIPSGQPGTGYTHIHVAFYSDSGCVTQITGWATADMSTLDSWQYLNLTDWAPIGVVSARVGLVNQKTSAGDFQVLHDSIHFGRSPEMLFADGFQSSDTSEWSNVVGGTESL
jgi:hypothetical protein